MKAIDVATKNFITIDDVVEICKELNITCKDSAAELNEHDAFLVERRIESVKKRKLEDAEKARKNKKIKLKKKVDLSDDIRKKKGLELREKTEGAEEHVHEEEIETEKSAPIKHEKVSPAESVQKEAASESAGTSEKETEKRPHSTQTAASEKRPETRTERPQGSSDSRPPRPQGSGTDNRTDSRPPRPQGQGTGQRTPYQGSGTDSRPPRPQGQGTGQRTPYQGSNPRPQGQGTGQRTPYQGSNPRPQGQGTGQRTPYQGSGTDSRPPRPQGQGTGQRTPYQGSNPRPQGQGTGQRTPYQGSSDGRPRPQGQRTDSRTGGPGRDGAPRGGAGRRPGGKDEAPSSIEIDDQAAKKNKGLDKEKEKERQKEKESRRLNKREKEEAEKALILKKKQTAELRRLASPDKINITESVTVGELSKKLNVKASEVIGKLMKLGVMATINQVIDSDTAAILSAEYNTEVSVVSLFDETVIKNEQEDKAEDSITRPPVVTVMGHVDHGKTRLLDAIRSANVIDSEFGGITQHIGAYTVSVGEKKITFFDTPGHAAFTTMRARGASITDIVILVVAANDGVMPQTVEAISHAKAANVPIIVAINKIDLPEANTAKVRQELTGYGLIPEEWGGTTLFAEISAKQNLNIDQLLELVIIQAEMLELKANPKLLAKGAVIESRLDPGRGAVSTVLIQSGTLHVGDPFVVGVYSGKVRAMFDDKGNPIEEAGPSVPVEILGISGVPAAGDPFEGVDGDRMAKQVSHKRLEYKRIESAKKVRKVTLESLNEMIKEGEVKDLVVIVKADVDGSAQALTEALEKLSNEEIRVRVIHSGAGGINDSDVMLASASNAVIIGYHVRPTGKVSDLADKENVSIKFYNIIFEATDDIKAAMEGMLSPIFEEKILGTGEIRQVFKVSKIGSIAGCVCMSGKITRKAKMRILREGVVVFDGPLASLKRYKDDVSVVEAGQEFGFSTDNFNDMKEGDTFEAYEVIQIAKKL
ncbi:MAG: translation initiation factor IF-2 [Spirochaetae bacterium HGW-Spirochaetae-5]|nr:MAG: translation initiation factor IF-2 [Spirochaetae bacterium HGW-Spirochaetae-5]